jgi:hypothetical protein
MVGDPIAEHPEAIGAFRVPRADVPVAEVAPTLCGEDAIPESDLSLAVLSDFFDTFGRLERGKSFFEFSLWRFSGGGGG